METRLQRGERILAKHIENGTITTISHHGMVEYIGRADDGTEVSFGLVVKPSDLFSIYSYLEANPFQSNW